MDGWAHSGPRPLVVVMSGQAGRIAWHGGPAVELQTEAGPNRGSVGTSSCSSEDRNEWIRCVNMFT